MREKDNHAVRWEDVANVWRGPDYTDHLISFDRSVTSAYVDGRIITCVDVLDWDGDGGRDLLLSSWDACYDGCVDLRQEIGVNVDGSPILGAAKRLKNIRGFVTSFRADETFHLVSVSRLRPTVFIYLNTGSSSAPEFGIPLEIEIDCDWVKGNETLHVARFFDIDGDGQLELIIGTDFWDDYWPNGLEWNDTGYRSYDSAGRWLGGPLRGFAYVFKNSGTWAKPEFSKGQPLCLEDGPIEVYGQLAPAFGNLSKGKSFSMVAGEFWNILHHFSHYEGAKFKSEGLIKSVNETALELDHCIHIPSLVDWNGNGKLDILVGAEDGYICVLLNEGFDQDGFPVFGEPQRLETPSPKIHASVLPVPAAFDWTNNGAPDLMVGNSTGELLFFENIGGPEGPVFARDIAVCSNGAKIRISAGLTGSRQGPSEKRFGYTCPTVSDWDQDGHHDILMSDIHGRHLFYKRKGTSLPPEFEAPMELRYQGRPLRTVWRVKPAVVDWHADGKLSYVTLDEVGELASYSKSQDNHLASKTPIFWETGGAIRFTDDVGGGRGRMKFCAGDWTGSGTTDLIVGTHARASVPPGLSGVPRATTGQAAVLLLENVGKRGAPVFLAPRTICHQGKPIAMGMHACSPDIVDFRGNGSYDLVVGIEDGSIAWLKREDLTW